MHCTPAGFPEGISGMADEIDGAMQHAPQPARQSMVFFFQLVKRLLKSGRIETSRLGYGKAHPEVLEGCMR
jgi:hypothetical protein